MYSPLETLRFRIKKLNHILKKVIHFISTHFIHMFELILSRPNS